MNRRRSAVITGAAGGLGAAFARRLASEEYELLLTDSDSNRLNILADELSRNGAHVRHFVVDLASNRDVDLLVDVISREDDIKLLINNAGFGINKAFTVSQLDAEQQLLDVLVRTPMRLMHVALPLMKQRNKGVVINVSSVASFIAGGTYSASKSYLTVLSESLHTELAGTNVKVSALCPGFTRTEFHQRGRMSMKGLPSFMWLDSDELVAKSWSDALKGEAISIPGWQYQLLVFVIKRLPRSIVRKVGMNVRTKQRK